MKYAPDRIGLLYIYQLHLIKVSCTALGGTTYFHLLPQIVQVFIYTCTVT